MNHLSHHHTELAVEGRPLEAAFTLYARRAHAAGLVVVPTAPDDAKRPLVRGWTRQRGRPRLSTVDTWARQFPGANLAYQPAPSGMVVLDLDDRGHEDRARHLLGIYDPTVIVVTGRGLHIPLASPPISGVDLRRFGIAAEIKGTRSIVVAPGSVHPGTGGLYRFAVGDWEQFAAVPQLDRNRLEGLIGKHLDFSDVIATPTRTRNPEGSRNNATFAHLRAVASCGLLSSRDDVRAAALEYNKAYNDPSEPESKVIATADSVWRLIEQGSCRPPSSAALVMVTGSEHAKLRGLNTQLYNYADAMTLLVELKAAHGARVVQRGETFAIAATAMAEAGVVPGWTDRKRFMKATKALISVGLIVRVSGAVCESWTDANGKRRVTPQRAAQYRLN